MVANRLFMTAAGLCLAVAGCASTEDVRALRRPIMPPTQIALADRGEPLHESIALYEILGAPEYRFIDGVEDTSIISTRPTRAQIAARLNGWLSHADMLAEDIAHARYLLTIVFEDLRGPDFIPFSDKNASASVRYELRDRMNGDLVFVGNYDAQMRARMPGVTPEMARSAIFGGVVGAVAADAMSETLDSSEQATIAGLTGALIGGATALNAAAVETLLWDWPEAALEQAMPRIAHGETFGLAIGLAASDIPATGMSNAEIGLHGAGYGALIGLVAAAPTGRPPEHWNSAEAQGSFWGGERREQAVTGMMRQHFNQFLFALEEQSLLKIRAAAPCDELNPDGAGRSYLSSTADAVGYDCPQRTTVALGPDLPFGPTSAIIPHAR